jgi:hypothetical protein
MAAKYQERIITLWAVFLLGTLFHTQLGLMPLFHNQSIALHGARERSSMIRNAIERFTLALRFFTRR